MKAFFKAHSTLVFGCLLALATVLAYAQVASFDFTNYDERTMVLENPYVNRGLTAQGLWWALTTSWFDQWHPLSWWSHMLDCELFGVKPAGHHLVSLAFHVANVLVLFALLKRMTGALWRSAVVAALFSLHPLHVESVAWVAERKDLLSTLFFLLSIWAYVEYVLRGGGGEGDRSSNSSGASFFNLSLVLFVLALMSKPMVVTLPFVLLLLDFWPLKRVQSRHLVSGELKTEAASAITSPHFLPLTWEKWPYFALSFGLCLITYFGMRQGHLLQSTAVMPWGLRLANVPVSYARYLGKLFWPANLAVLYPLPKHLGMLPVAGLSAVLVLISVALVAMTLTQKRKDAKTQGLARDTQQPRVEDAGWRMETSAGGERQSSILHLPSSIFHAPSSGLPWPALAVGWFWFLGTLVPVIGIVAMSWAAIADRYTYIPSIGIFIAVVWLVPDLCGGVESASASLKRSTLSVFTLAVLAVLGILTWRQSVAWRDSIALWSRCLEVTRGNAIAEYNFGHALDDAGKTDAAAEHFRAALAIDPNHVGANVNFGRHLAAAGRMSEATNYFQRAIAAKRDDEIAQRHLGIALVELGDFGGAIEHLNEAARLDPMDPAAFANLGRAYSGQGKSDEAIRNFSQALYLAHDYEQGHYYLGLEWLKKGKFEPAIASFNEVLRLNPGRADVRAPLERATHARDAAEIIAHWRTELQGNPRSQEAMNNLAWILSTCPEASLRNGDEAVGLAERACELSGQKETVYIGTLSAAYAEAGQFEKAVAASEKACALAESLGQTNLLVTNRELLKHFKNKEAYREGYH